MFKDSVPAENSALRNTIRANRVMPEDCAVASLINMKRMSSAVNNSALIRAKKLTEQIRKTKKPDILSVFLAEYNLSTEEGLALMSLAETLLRVPDSATKDQLIADKIANKKWSEHHCKSNSTLVNLTTISLNIVDKIIKKGNPDNLTEKLRTFINTVSNPAIGFAMSSVMDFFGKQFVFSTSIQSALKKPNTRSENIYYSFDMLGEAAWTMADANKYFLRYKNALISIGKNNKSKTAVFDGNNLSIKLSALHPKYNFYQKPRVMSELLPRVMELIDIAIKYNVGVSIDAEEAERLDISLDIVKEVVSRIKTAQWDGFGVVVQAYQKRAPYVLDWLYEMAQSNNVKIAVRLVKGAYWDTEIKNSQLKGDTEYPVYTKKIHTDFSYIVCAEKLLNMRDCIYPQFASHNVHTLIKVYELAGKTNKGYEIQRLHGMGEAIHELLTSDYGIKSRIYAPVGGHQDLLAYLIRRLLENGANSSFINQLFDVKIPTNDLITDVVSQVENSVNKPNSKIPMPIDIFGSKRVNSKGLMLSEQDIVADLDTQLADWLLYKWNAKAIISTQVKPVVNKINNEPVKNPADLDDIVGTIEFSNTAQIPQIVDAANLFYAKKNNFNNDLEHTRKCLLNTADLIEKNSIELTAIAIREAGKTYQDCVDEIREAVDFLRYYAHIAQKEFSQGNRESLGVFVCISPWNFPLAIFCGQIAAALASGNAVIAKPAESTSLMAYRATQLFHEAGFEVDRLQLVLGCGKDIGSELIKNKQISGVAFTGSTITAKLIKKTLVEIGNIETRLIAETGGLNAMVVDSTALPEQVARDVIDSAFKSAGQRCSALRLLILQEDIADIMLEIITGALKEINVGNPKYLDTECGPVISDMAKKQLNKHINDSVDQGMIVHTNRHTGILATSAEKNAHFVYPTIIKLNDLDELNEEFFGPILHIVSYKKTEIDTVLTKLNAKGYGLTFGVHSRINENIAHLSSNIHAGNVYVNRNQIGAVVGSQPFGGDGLSGTGPKAGGPLSLHGYSRSIQHVKLSSKQAIFLQDGEKIDTKNLRKPIVDKIELNQLKDALTTIDNRYFEYLVDKLPQYTTPIQMPSPTGETNELLFLPKGCVLCLGPSNSDALIQTVFALMLGNSVITKLTKKDYDMLLNIPGISKNFIVRLQGFPSKPFMLNNNDFQAIFWFGDLQSLETITTKRTSAIIPIIQNPFEEWRLIHEKLIATDTTAFGGNADLLSA